MRQYLLATICEYSRSDAVCITGNHDLWIEKGDGFKDSLKKFYAILQMCKQVGVYTDVVKLHVMQEETGDIQPLWVVPLYSWYVKPEDDAMESLYYQPKSGKLEDVEHMEAIWADNIRCKWPTMTETLASYFASLNEANLSRTYDCPVISFTHFVPRQDLVIPTQEDLDQANKERQRQGTPIIEKLAEPALDKFNISRYSGAKVIDRQLRQIGSVLHVYGHQHSNRDRSMEGVRYVSHCLGYPKEGKSGMTWGISEWKGPKVIWPQNKVSKSDA
jgi:hypothetical protein